MKRLTFVGPINAFTGYGLHSIEVILGLTKLGYHVSVRPTGIDRAFGRVPDDIIARYVNSVQPEPWELLLHPPSMNPTPGKKTAFFTMWESTRMRAGGVQMINRAEMVIVPCAWNASCFSAEGVSQPIRIVPLGIKPEIFYQRAPVRVPSEDDPPVVFGAAARAKHGGVRKGLQDVIDIFQLAFPDETNVRLKIKCFADDPAVRVEDKRIELVREFWDEHRLADWFASLDAFMSLSRGEGWGLMQHQAMAVGRPVIGPAFGGLTEFMHRDNSYTTRYQLVPTEGGYTGMGLWAEADLEDVISSMRQVYEQRGEAEARGARAAESVAHLTWEHSIAALEKVLKEAGAL